MVRVMYKHETHISCRRLGKRKKNEVPASSVAVIALESVTKFNSF